MRLDFNVLWVEDQPNAVRAQVDRIANAMAEEGFNLNATLLRSAAEVTERLASDVFTDEVDLILVDWDLGAEIHGQDIIAIVRDKIRFKDVVFYSAQTLPAQLREAAFQAGLEGVYCATREDLVEEVLAVFDSLVKKVMDLDHSRGIVMAATSDIDEMVNDCLETIHDQLDSSEKGEMIAAALKRIDEKIVELTKSASELKNASSLEAFFVQHQLFTANDRLRILSGMLKKPQYKLLAKARKAAGKYLQDIIPHRNKLGHKTLVPAGKPTAADGSGETITADKVREMRRVILVLRGEFRELLSALKGK